MSEPRWSLHHAKNQLSSVVDAAARGEPQLVTKHGRPAAVVLAVEEYRRLKALEARARPGFAEQLLALPQDDGGFERVEVEPRAVEL
jgi:prevent-host-death family protein